ncbi:MAG: peptidyl-prolyl cis-trans isomerase [candidate division KSB1 bacterium]|nr:peptidyl-prolyl cis-trans isomerase [candidate division KSB1 bacterium]
MVLKRFSATLFILVLILSALSGCGDKAEQPLARVGGRVITVTDFESGFTRGKSEEALGKATLDEKLNYLNKLVENELKIVAAYSQGLDKDPKVIEQVNKRGENTILRQLVEDEVVSRQIPESLLKKVYKKSGKHVKVYEIALKKNQQSGQDQQKILDDKIAEIKEEIKKGMEFSELVTKYSEGGNKSAVHPRLLKWSPLVSEDPVYIEAYSMRQGDVSKPIATETGVSIIKVIEVIDVELRPFEDQKRRIKQEFLRMKGRELEKTYMDFISGLKKRYNAQLFEENIDIILRAATEDTSVKKKLAVPIRVDSMLARLSDEELQKPLFTYDGGVIDIDAFFEEYARFPVMRRPNITEKSEVLTLMNRRLIPQVLLTKEAERKNISEKKEVKEVLKGFRENIMLTRIKSREVDSKVNVTDSLMMDYFERHRDEFKEPETRSVQEIFVKDAERANEVAAKAKSGKDFDWLAERYNEKPSTIKKKGKLGYIQENRAHLGKPAFETELNGVTGPIKIGSNYSIIKVLDIREEKLKSFSESKRFLRSKVSRELSNSLEQAWLDKLKKEIDVSIYENRLEKLFEEHREDE